MKENQNRIQLIIYTRKTNTQQKLSQYGHVVYISKKMNYVCLYINELQKDNIINRIKKLHGIQRIEVSKQALSAMTEK